MDDEAFRKMIEAMSKEIDAEVSALAVDDDLFPAVRKLSTEEYLLKQRYANREITKDEYSTEWNALMDNAPEEVLLASIKFSQAMIAALSKRPDTPEA
jgi:hypothetical protein